MISTDRWPQIKELFADAMEVRPERRASILRAVCSEVVLLDEVRRLIELYERAGGFLNEPAKPLYGRQVGGFEKDQMIGGRYRIDRLIGRGGMCGGVYGAFDLSVNTTIALKATNDIREFFTARTVDHRNVCKVFECGKEGDVPFLTMEMLDGATLEEHLAAHGPMKPANVFITVKGRVVIIDFGLARFVDPSVPAGSRQSAGTLSYMAPEVMAGRPASARSDLYSLGVILYEALTSEIATDSVPLSEGLNDAVRNCLQLEPLLRPVSAEAVGSTIGIKHEPIHCRTPVDQWKRPDDRMRWTRAA